MQNMNALIRKIPPDQRGDKRELKLLAIRPSIDLGALAFELKDELPPTLRHLLGRFGTDQVGSRDFLSTVLFESTFIDRLIEVGEKDGDALGTELQEFVEA